MQELIEILEGLAQELRPIVSDPRLMQYLARCIELARENLPPEETQEQIVARLQGKVEAYEYAINHINSKF